MELLQKIYSVKDEDIEKTIKAFQPLHLSKHLICKKLLIRPPIKYIQDIVKNVINTFNFPLGVFDESCFVHLKNKEEKLHFLRILVDFITFCSPKEFSCKAIEICAGKHSDNTNILLQEFAYLAQRAKSNDLEVFSILDKYRIQAKHPLKQRTYVLFPFGSSCSYLHGYYENYNSSYFSLQPDHNDHNDHNDNKNQSESYPDDLCSNIDTHTTNSDSKSDIYTTVHLDWGQATILTSKILHHVDLVIKTFSTECTTKNTESLFLSNTNVSITILELLSIIKSFYSNIQSNNDIMLMSNGRLVQQQHYSYPISFLLQKLKKPFVIWFVLDSPSINCRYEMPMDTNGVFYYLGLQNESHIWKNPFLNHQIQIKHSGSGGGLKEYLTNREIYSSLESPFTGSDLPWLIIRLLKYKLCPNHYCLWQEGVACLRNWNLEGSNDEIHWTILKHHVEDQTILTDDPFGHWNIECSEYYQSFRINLTGVSLNGEADYDISEIEFYGNLRPIKPN